MNTNGVATVPSIEPTSELKIAIVECLFLQLSALAIALYSICKDVQSTSVMWIGIVALIAYFGIGQVWYVMKVNNGRAAEQKNATLKDYYRFSNRFFLATILISLFVHRR